MQKKKLPRDANSLAARIVALSTETDEPDLGTKPKTTTKVEREKNPAAVALGKLGGLKGGHARAASLSSHQRQEIARKAADARWSKKAK